MNVAYKMSGTNGYHMIIGGARVLGASSIDVINPATEKVLATCPRADIGLLEEAVAAAKAAFPGWAALPMATRRVQLMRIADAMEARAEEIAQLLTAEQGKPLADAMNEVGGSIYMLRGIAALDLPLEVVKDDDTGRVIRHRTPLGVVAAITPWNYPVFILVVKAVSAILAGNTVVAKPAPTTPLSSLVVGSIFNDVLPRGVFNIIVDQNDLGGLLTKHPDVAKVSFTGSTLTGKKVAESGASTLKRITLELGGNDAAIVLDGVDPKKVAQQLFNGAMVNAGQVCAAIKRVYAPESIHDSLCDELAALARQAIVGDGMKQGVQIGPLQNKQQYEKVKEIIEDARRRGKIIAGGYLLDGPGYFIPPTIVRDLPDDARLVREEQFGPVLPVLQYKTLEECLERVNDSDYGLTGTVWAADPQRGLEIAMKVNSGVVWVNQHMTVDPLIPVGGAKQSGIGQELGLDGVKEFTQSHMIFEAPGTPRA
jgi:acyl-CoA reductase-like NAD-dependent aldehyde dehydrogenase